VASEAAASVASAAAWGQPIPGYGRPGGGVRADHPTHTRGVLGTACRPSARHPRQARSALWLLAVIARNAYIAAEVVLVAAPSL
jgi:hypothetical protein